MKQIRMIVLGLAAAVVLALILAGRTAVNRAYDYREMTARKSLHQLTLETRAEEERDGTMLFGAGLFAVALLACGGLIFAATSGREFGRASARRRRKSRAAPSPAGDVPAMPRLRVLPPAPSLPAIPALPSPSTEEGRHEAHR